MCICRKQVLAGVQRVHSHLHMLKIHKTHMQPPHNDRAHTHDLPTQTHLMHDRAAASSSSSSSVTSAGRTPLLLLLLAAAAGCCFDQEIPLPLYHTTPTTRARQSVHHHHMHSSRVCISARAQRMNTNTRTHHAYMHTTNCTRKRTQTAHRPRFVYLRAQRCLDTATQDRRGVIFLKYKICAPLVAVCGACIELYKSSFGHFNWLSMLCAILY